MIRQQERDAAMSQIAQEAAWLRRTAETDEVISTITVAASAAAIEEALAVLARQDREAAG